MKNKWLAAIGIYIGLIMICVFAIYAVPSLRGVLDRTYVTENGRLDITDDVAAYIVRDETVYVAGQESKVNRLADADRLVKAHTRVVELTPTDSAGSGGDADNISSRYASVINSLDGDVVITEGGKCRESGYVSFHVDGAEARLSTDRLADLKQDDYKSLTNLRSVETPTRKCSKGEPVFKIVKNTKWYLVFYIDTEDASGYYAGRYVTMNVNGRDIRVQVKDVAEGTDITRVTLTCKTFFDGFLEKRTLKTTITLASAQGLILKDSSIVVTEDGGLGVFVKNKLGRHVYRPIALKADDGDKCVAYSDIYVDADGNFVETLKTYDEIVEQPTDEDLKSQKAVMLTDKRSSDKEDKKE